MMKEGSKNGINLLKDEMDILDKEKALMEEIAKLIAEGKTGPELERLRNQLKY